MWSAKLYCSSETFGQTSSDSVEAVFQFPLDAFVEELTTAGIKIIGVIVNGYLRFLPDGLNMEDANGYISRLTKSSEKIVEHYKDSVVIWQIENEPNWWAEHYSTGWRKGGIWFLPGIHQRILSVLCDTLRSEAPNATIVVNLEADRRNTNWNEYARYCDVLGLNFYPNYLHSTPVDASSLRLSQQAREETGLQVFVAETGYPSGPGIFGFIEERQAGYIDVAVIMNSASFVLPGNLM